LLKLACQLVLAHPEAIHEEQGGRRYKAIENDHRSIERLRHKRHINIKGGADKTEQQP